MYLKAANLITGLALAVSGDCFTRWVVKRLAMPACFCKYAAIFQAKNDTKLQ
jgi:hypothetical protein